MNKYFLFLSFTLFASIAYSQELLNKNKNQIKAYMNSQGGILSGDKIGDDGIIPGPYNMLLYTFPKSKIENTDIYNILFLLKNQDKCYEYEVKYGSDKFLKELISKFNKPNSGLKKAGNDLKWIDKVKKYEIEILTTKRFNKEGQTVNTTAFVLDIHKIG